MRGFERLDRWTRRKLPWTVVALILLFGSIQVFIFPPGQNPDEGSHLTRSVMVSEGKIFAREEAGVWGQDIPSSLAAYIDSHNYMIFKMDQKYPYARWYADSHATTDEQGTVFRTYTTQASSPLYYLPQVVGMSVGKILYAFSPADWNWSAALYFARFGNLVAYALVFGLAIRAVPRFGGLLTFAALNPMTLSLGASANYDVTVIAVAVGFFALVFSSLQRAPNLRRLDWALLVACAFMLGHSKVVYAPVLLILVVLWQPLGLVRWVKLAGACGFAAVVGAVLSSRVFGLPQTIEFQARIQEQAAYVASHIHDMPGLIWRSALEYADHHFITALGDLGSLDTNFTLPLLVVWAAVGFLAIVLDAGSSAAPAVAKKGIAVVALLAGSTISVIALYLAMYITWTSWTTGVGVPSIDSVQGRYLLPLFPFVMAAFALALGWAPRRLMAPRPHLLSMLLLAGIFVQSMTLFIVLARYWIPAPA